MPFNYFESLYVWKILIIYLKRKKQEKSTYKHFSLQETLQKGTSNAIIDPEMYSIEDLMNIRNGEMKTQLKYLVELCCRHTAECEVCDTDD